MNFTRLIFLASLVAFGTTAAFAGDGGDEHGVVYTLSNEASGNRILSFNRQGNGHLVPGRSYATGGLGTGAGLGSQGSISASEGGNYIIAVNPGSNSISLFAKEDDKLKLLDIQPSGGVDPISVTQSGRFVYVLNGGDAQHPNNLQEFVRFEGRLVKIGDGVAQLSGPSVGPAQVSFTPDGEGLVVTEKGTNMIDTFQLDWFDRPASSSFQASAGTTPFGFSFGPDHTLFVTDAFGGAAGASALSSYKILPDLSLVVKSAAVATHQTSACWSATSPTGDWVYSSNTGSGTVSGFSIKRPQGTVSLLDSSGVTGTVGGAAVDSAFTPGGRFFYVLSDGTKTITAFKVREDGSLVNLGKVDGLPASVVGLVAL